MRIERIEGNVWFQGVRKLTLNHNVGGSSPTLVNILMSNVRKRKIDLQGDIQRATVDSSVCRRRDFETPRCWIACQWPKMKNWKFHSIFLTFSN